MKKLIVLIVVVFLCGSVNADTIADFEGSTIDATAIVADTVATPANLDAGTIGGSWSNLSSVSSGVANMVAVVPDTLLSYGTGSQYLFIGEANNATATSTATLTLDTAEAIGGNAPLSMDLMIIGRGGQAGGMYIEGFSSTGETLFKLGLGNGTNGASPGPRGGIAHYDAVDARTDVAPAESVWIGSGAIGEVTMTLGADDYKIDIATTYTAWNGIVTIGSHSFTHLSYVDATGGDLARIDFTALNSKTTWGIDNIVVVPVYFTTAHEPDPEDGEQGVFADLTDRIVSGAASWLAPDDPNAVAVFGYNVYMDPNETKVADANENSTTLIYQSLQSGGQTGTSYAPAPSLSDSTTYFWRVDAIIDWDYVPGSTINDANTVIGSVWSFTTKDADLPPTVDAGPSILTLTGLTIPSMGGSVSDDGTSSLTIQWTAYEDVLGGVVATDVVFADATNPDTTISLTVPGTYILELTATDALGPVSANKAVVLFDAADACNAAKHAGAGGWAANYYDRDADCDVDLDDFAKFAFRWLNSTVLTDTVLY